MGDQKLKHSEYACHHMGQNHQNLLNEIKMMLDTMDDRPCLVNEQKRKVPPMMQYPGYVDTRHTALHPAATGSEMYSCHKPCHRFGICANSAEPVDVDPNAPTTKSKVDKPKVKNENPYENACSKYGMTSPGAYYRVRNQSAELRGGTILSCCDCLKRNGLQDQCPRSDCGTPKCLAYNPGPCCGPAIARRKYGEM